MATFPPSPARFGPWRLAGALAVAAGCLLNGTRAQAEGLHPVGLRCEYRANPLGIDETQPRLSWLVQSDQRHERQAACQILVASSPALLKQNQADLWDSGKRESDETIGTAYAGQPLVSQQHCYWKVRVWDQDGRTAWSQPAEWSMGLLSPEDWHAAWIGDDADRNKLERVPDRKFLPPASYLRTTFQASHPVTRATLYVSALGLVEPHLNGQRISNEYFTPGWTDYAQRVHYRTYDVTKLIRNGENILGAILADGWYCGYVGYEGKRDYYGRAPRLRMQLQIDYADGPPAIIGTGPEWQAKTGPILEADLLQGESYDARRELTGWDAPDGPQAPGWSPVVIDEQSHPLLQAHPGPPIREIAEFRAKSISQPQPGIYVLNFGQNFSGIPRLQLTSTTAGQQIALRFAERLNPDGTLYTANLRTARATDTYICQGGGPETWEPHFTYHGFQYLEITGLTAPPTIDTVIGVALGSDTPVAGSFACSDPMLNQLRSNIYWTQRANFLDLPTDCPQRDERLGWTGDAQIYVRTATLNCDVQAFFTKWLVDLCHDSQRADGAFPAVAPLAVAPDEGGPGWADAGVICPWTIYEVYGDRRQLERHYDAMTRFLAFCQRRSQSNLLPPANFASFGDWLNIHDETPKDVIATAYFAYSAALTARAADVLGKAEDAAKYQDLSQRIKAAFNQAYVSADGHITGDTQTAYVLALGFDLVEGERAQQAAAHLITNLEKRDWHLATGFLGTKDLMLVLAKIGRNDIAYRLIHNDTFPSWGFSIKQGATSTWERWNGWTPEQGFADPAMNSFAHYAFGAVEQWMVENIGGIRADEPSYRHLVIAPQLDGQLTSANVSYDSIRGRIQSEWKKEPDRFILDVTIPANTTATVRIPVDPKVPSHLTESGDPPDEADFVKLISVDPNTVELSIQSGTYHFLLESERP